jgi:sec-independent protein translocase protein TatA
MGSIGPGELLIIALIALLLFGAGRVADIGKGLGQGIRNFKEGLRDHSEPKGSAEKQASAHDEKGAPAQLGVGDQTREPTVAAPPIREAQGAGSRTV